MSRGLEESDIVRTMSQVVEKVTAGVIRMSLFGTWHVRILVVMRAPGTLKGCERLGCLAASMGTISVEVSSKPAALFGHPAETNLGLASDAKTRIGTCSSKPTIHVPN